MIWPSAQDYNEAVQNPSTSFADPDLRSGTVECNRLGLPKVMSGAFASVYRVDCGTTPWAVRCFLNCRPDQEERYKLISDFVLFDDLDCTVPFYYLEKGIKWKGNWYPVLKMEWVEGRTLEKFLDENFNKKNVVLDLLKQFDELILDLNRAGIAHGDLQHGNIIVTDNGLRLVDYDALYVPALKGLQNSQHLVEIKRLVAERMSSQFSNINQIASWQRLLGSVNSFERASFTVLDTICDTGMRLFQQSSSNAQDSSELDQQSALVTDQICQFMLSVTKLYVEHDASQRVTKHLAALIEHDSRFSARVAMSLRLVASILLLKDSAEREAAAILAGVVSPKAMLQDLTAQEETVQTLLLSAGSEAVELFVQAGDMERADQSRSRHFYLGAAFVYNALPLSLSNRILSLKLSERLGDLPNSAGIRAELSEFQETDETRRVNAQ